MIESFENSITYRYFTKARVNRMPFHSHIEHEIYYFHSGKGNYLIGDKIFVLQPGDLIIMYGLTLHCSNIDLQHDYTKTTLHFDPLRVGELLAPFPAQDVLKPFRELGHLRLQLLGDEKSEVEELLRKMDVMYKLKDDVSQSRFLLTMLELLYLVFRLCERPMEDKAELHSGKERHVQKMIAFIENHYQDEISLEQLEKNLHLNKTYLSKIFKDVTDATIFNYIYHRRINQAKVLFLLEKTVSCTDVCFQVGFKHLAHFSRIFKEQVGCTPEQYKRGTFPR